MAPVPRSFPENEILIALFREAKAGRTTGLTVKQLVEATERSEGTIRRHLRGLCLPARSEWIERLSSHPATYRLTAKGSDVAAWRYKNQF